MAVAGAGAAVGTDVEASLLRDALDSRPKNAVCITGRYGLRYARLSIVLWHFLHSTLARP